MFKLYVQTPRANMWYPCGSFVADERAQSLVDGWVANSMGMGGMIKVCPSARRAFEALSESRESTELAQHTLLCSATQGQIDRAVASTLFQGESKKAMTLNIVKQYPALKPSQRELRFGYKIGINCVCAPHAKTNPRDCSHPPNHDAPVSRRVRRAGGIPGQAVNWNSD